jgi:hypothetical protein
VCACASAVRRCDREDRHRGLCNHRATIAGPTAIPTTGSASTELEDDSEEEEEEQEGQGTSQMDTGAQRFFCLWGARARNAGVLRTGLRACCMRRHARATKQGRA